VERPGDFDGRALSHGRHRVLDGMLRSDRSASASWTIGKDRFSRRSDPKGGGAVRSRIGTVSGDAARGVMTEDEFLVVACASAIWGIDEDLDWSECQSFIHGLALGLDEASIRADAGSRIFGLRPAVFESSLISCTITLNIVRNARGIGPRTQFGLFNLSFRESNFQFAIRHGSIAKWSGVSWHAPTCRASECLDS
jgi:hypothetical protein